MRATRTWLTTLTVGLSLLMATSGCFVGQNRVAKLQDAAHDLNMASRFGRMDVATEHISEKEYGDFAKRHALWGRQLRIVDVEFQGMQFIDKHKALVFVAYGWQRLDEQELRVTSLTQIWDYEAGHWKLTDETRSGGDPGLIGDDVDVMRPTRTGNAQFPSISIR